VNSSNNNIGGKLYEMIEDKGLPWGVGSTALIAGLGARLINLSFSVSKIENSISKERIKTLFLLCDKDDRLFQEFINDDDGNNSALFINEVPIQLLEQIIFILNETVGYDDNIKENVKVDYFMGLSYLKEAASQLLHIIYNNLANIEKNMEEMRKINGELKK